MELETFLFQTCFLLRIALKPFAWENSKAVAQVCASVFSLKAQAILSLGVIRLNKPGLSRRFDYPRSKSYWSAPFSTQCQIVNAGREESVSREPTDSCDNACLIHSIAIPAFWTVKTTCCMSSFLEEKGVGTSSIWSTFDVVSEYRFPLSRLV